eukprot:6198070-Pleurochrysis_carterae.AAC.3
MRERAAHSTRRYEMALGARQRASTTFGAACFKAALLMFEATRSFHLAVSAFTQTKLSRPAARSALSTEHMKLLQCRAAWHSEGIDLRMKLFTQRPEGASKAARSADGALETLCRLCTLAHVFHATLILQHSQRIKRMALRPLRT